MPRDNATEVTATSGEHPVQDIPHPPRQQIRPQDREWVAPLVALGTEDSAYIVVFRALESAGSEGARRRIVQYFYDKVMSED